MVPLPSPQPQGAHLHVKDPVLIFNGAQLVHDSGDVGVLIDNDLGLGRVGVGPGVGGRAVVRRTGCDDMVCAWSKHIDAAVVHRGRCDDLEKRAKIGMALVPPLLRSPWPAALCLR